MANTPKSKSPMTRVLDEGMVATILTGDIWSKDEAEIADIRETFGTVLEALKLVSKEFDTRLVDLRKVNGSDHLESVKYFRKPREAKNDGGENPLMSTLSV